MRKIDLLLVRSFFPPFLITFGLAMFVLLMQQLWKYIDDIIGKGASIFTIFEFIAYLCVVLVPMALPVAVLLSSIMVMGGLSERYELTCMKTAGVSLWRIMRPLIVICSLISVFSFICANNIVPVAMLKFKTRLYNLKTQKLALSIEKDVFNDDFRNFVIRIDDKDEETGEIIGVTVYDHTSPNRNDTKIISAQRGKLDFGQDDRYLIMQLNDGVQYQEVEESQPRKNDDPRRYPYTRVKFSELEKMMNLSEFEMKDDDDRIFRNQHEMLSVRQLSEELDTIGLTMDGFRDRLGEITANYFHFIKTSDSTSFYRPLDSLHLVKGKQQISAKPRGNFDREPKGIAPLKIDKSKVTKEKKLEVVNNIKKTTRKNAVPENKNINKTALLGTPEQFAHVMAPFHRAKMVERAMLSVNNIAQKSNEQLGRIKREREKELKYIYNWHYKFSLAISCLIFLLIGAPLGAIIRKGGLGYPILVGIILFVLFVVSITVFRKFAEADSLPFDFLGAWMPIFIFLIPCFLLVRGAMREAKVPDINIVLKKISTFFSFGRRVG